MNVQHLQSLIQQSAMIVGSMRGVYIKAVASPSDVDDSITVVVVVTTEKEHGPEFPSDFHLKAAELSLSDARVQHLLEHSFETAANEFNAQHGKGAYDAGINWKRR